MDYVDSIKKIIKQFLKTELPDLLTIHYPVYGKIVRSYSISDKNYVDVRILKKNKEVDEAFPELPQIQGTYFKGQIVRIMFYYNDLDLPYIDGAVNE